MDRPGSRRGASLDEFLEHYGIPGMRWGVRRTNPSASAPASDDARRVATLRGTVKKGGTKTLSNRELQEVITRMNLERQYKALAPTRKQQVASFVGRTLLGIGKQEVTKLAAEQAAKQVANLLKK